MDELKKLLDMDLSDEAKALLAKVNANVTELNVAKNDAIESLRSKDNAISEMTAQRAELKSKVSSLTEEVANGGTKDNGEQIEALTNAHNSKYGELEEQYKGLQAKVSEASRNEQFNSLNIASNFPKEFDESQISFAMKAIQREIFEGSVYDESNSSWGYLEDGKPVYDTMAKPMTIEAKAKMLMEQGAFDMFLAGRQGTGGGGKPNAGNAQPTGKTMPRSQFESLQPAQQSEFMSGGGNLTD